MVTESSKRRDIIILSTVLAGLFFEACTFFLTPTVLDESTPTCAATDLDPFEGCFGDLARDYVEISELQYVADSETCSEFEFSGHGSGVFRSSDAIWEFTGALIDGDTAGIAGTLLPDDMRLTVDSDTDQLTVQIYNEDGSLRTQTYLTPCP